MKESLELSAASHGASWLYQAHAQALPRHFHTHEELEFNLVVSGEAVYLTEDGRVDLIPGCILWLFPEQAHALHSSSNDFTMWIVVFRQETVRELCQTTRYLPLRSLYKPSAQSYAQLQPESSQDISALCEKAALVKDDVEFCNVVLHHLLIAAWDLTQTDTPLKANPKAYHPAVLRTVNTLYLNPENVSLSELAKAAGLSQEHLSRLFSRQIGMPIVEYRNRQRIRHFQKLYGQGKQLTLAEAAQAAGFGSYTQCYRIVQKYLNIKPSDLGN
ncbi:MAG: AraC family transcriptional regulator [Lentisphaeria bacterium]|nr:AraC family transcriptional regulator [Lentisphaeria bacterium]NQZ69700.1 AraC family transcriptional regulator [Lentisphaeria bacterium]